MKYYPILKSVKSTISTGSSSSFAAVMKHHRARAPVPVPGQADRVGCLSERCRAALEGWAAFQAVGDSISRLVEGVTAASASATQRVSFRNSSDPVVLEWEMTMTFSPT